jgi:hypothetical protein
LIFQNKAASLHHNLKNGIMATKIASIPVLTGEVAEQFEREAQQTYEQYLNRSEEERMAIRSRYEEGVRKVRAMLAKSKLGMFYDCRCL